MCGNKMMYNTIMGKVILSAVELALDKVSYIH